MRYQYKAVLFVFLILAVSAASFVVFGPAADTTELPNSAATASLTPDGEGQTLATVGPETAKAAYGRLPIHFEPNVGQTDERVKYVARGNGYSLFLTGSEAVLSLIKKGKGQVPERAAAVRLQFEGAAENAAISPVEDSAGRSNYLVGNDPNGWRTDVANYNKVKYSEIYPGIDLVFYGNSQQLEYDFVVQPGADTAPIALNFDGIKRASIDKKSGDLMLDTGAGTLRQHAPIVYQHINGERQTVAGRYKLDKGRVTFALGEYDRTKELVIDPILSYGSYLGGNAFDEGRGITVDAQGNAYIVGTAASLNFPTTAGVIKPQLLPSTNNQNWYDAFVTKMNPTGTALVWSTYYGGRNGSETGSDVALDASGNVLIAGTTMANDLPTVNAYQATFGGTDDAFAAKINGTGTAIIFSTYLGGNNTDLGGRIAVNRTTGTAVFAGFASSGNFPTTPGAYKPQLCNNTPGSCNGIFYNGSYIVKLAANGGVVYSTLFDAGIADVAIDSSDNATFAGTANASQPTTPGAFQPASSGGIDGYIGKMNPAGNALVFATFLGGGLQSDRLTGIALDADQNIYVTGRTENAGFPATAGAYDITFNGGEDGIITKLDPTGSSLVFSTFFGAAGKDQPFAIGLGAANDVFITGETLSGANFPLRNSLNGTLGNIFLSRINATGSSLVYSTFLGQGGGYGIAVDQSDNAYVTGVALSNILVTPTAFQTVRNNNPWNTSDKDGFVVKVAPTDENAATYSISGMVTNENYGFNNWDTAQIVLTVTGTVSRQITIPYSGGAYVFSSLPAGGNYTVTARKIGYLTTPEDAVFTNLGANQSADFTILRNREPEGYITTPAHGTTFNAPATINIQATATDPDGDPIAKVDFVAYSSAAGSIPLGTDTTAPYEFTWTNVPVGTWALYAIPTDSKGLRGTSMETVHVFVVNGGQVSVAFNSPTNGQSFTEGTYVPISMNVSPAVTLVQVRDENNQIVGWMPGPPWSTTWRVMQVGTHTLTAIAQDAQGNSATAEVNINVTPINHVISGRVTDDFTNAPVPDVTVSVTSPTNPSVTATTTTDASGAYSFTGLGTTPNDGLVITPSLTGYSFEPATKNITYLGYINWTDQNFRALRDNNITVQMTSPTQGQIFQAPTTIDLRADASTTVGTITKVEFFRGSTLIATDTTAPYEYQWTDAQPGTFIGLYARATDSTGGIRDSDPVTITIQPAPTAVRLQGDITNPAGGWVQGVTLVLTGTANGNPVNQTSVSNSFGAYGFFNLPAGGNYTITPQPVGTLTFTPTSRSFTNVNSDIFDINFVTSAPNQAPSVQINSPTAGSTFTMPAAIPVNVTATDVDGTIVHLTVTAVSQTMSTTVGQVNNGNFNVLWQPNSPGSYTLWATARDNGGLQTSVNITLTVNPPGPVSISGRAVDRNSVGIGGATVELREIAEGEPLVQSVQTGQDGSYTLANITTFRHYFVKVSKEEYSFSPQRRNFFNLNQAQAGIDFTGTQQTQISDFDGDGQTDFAVWRPATGVWYVNNSATGGYNYSQFGQGSMGDVVVPGNYDGDRKVDYAIFRQGLWFIRDSTDGEVRTTQFGMNRDTPVPADFDGDGRTDIAVWRGTEGVWHAMPSSTGVPTQYWFGTTGDIPLAADYDGDGIADYAVFRPSNGTWYIRQSASGDVRTVVFGTSGDIPVAGDFDGDKRCDVSVFRPSNGTWYVQRSSDDSFIAMPWGANGDKPVAGDYDRDGKTDLAVYRESDRTWYVRYSSNGQFLIRQYGANGDIPIPAAYVR